MQGRGVFLLSLLKNVSSSVCLGPQYVSEVKLGDERDRLLGLSVIFRCKIAL